ncbi:MAG: hypothetical protein MUF54_15515 [Polyangiaceae bacterium]|jgi:hypothetical protein|nr:hypothetical protein [Polyangiaceae bacterium]
MKRVSRNVLAERIAGVGTSEAKDLAEFVLSTRVDSAVPCWGAAIERASKELTEDNLPKLWQAMVPLGDSRPLLALLHLMREYPKLIELAAQDARDVPPVVRQGLRALTDKEAIEAQLGFETRIRQLLAVRYVMPDSVSPLHESERKG